MTSNEFNSEVGQVVNGKSVTESVTASGNIVNLSFTNSAKDGLHNETTKITINQRKRIYQAVCKMLIANHQNPESDSDKLAVYNDILAEFGVRKLDLLPAHKYREVIEFIEKKMPTATVANCDDRSISETKSLTSSENDRQNPAPTKGSVCTECSVLRTKLNLTMKLNAIIFALSLAIVLSSIVVLGINRRSEIQIGNGSSLGGQCSFNGVTHSPGATIKMADNLLRECTKSGTWEKQINSKPITN